MLLCDKLVYLRKKKGLSQEELAEQLNVTRQSVSKWEGGLSTPELDKIIQLSELYGVSLDYLIKDEQPTNESEEIVAQSAVNESTAEKQILRKLSESEAEDYLRINNRFAKNFAIGIPFCFISVALLIAGVLFGCVSGIVSLIIERKNKKK